MKFKNVVNWFEIPSGDLDRATKFFESIFNCTLVPMDLGNGLRMRMFPAEEGTTGGAVCHHADFYKPSLNGVVVYLNGNPDLQTVLDRVESSGGKVIMPKTEISAEYGFMALFTDTEGNRVGLHSSPKPQP